MNAKNARILTVLAVVVLLAAMVGQIVHAIKGESLTWDEGDHIFAGYESWKAHDYSLNPEHPPMVKMVATLPLLGLNLKVAPQQGRFFKTEAYLGGRELLFRNGPANGGQYLGRDLILRVRLFAMVFTVIAALLVFSAGTEMFGVGAGLMGLALFCFEPNLLAHGAYVTTDMAASCTFFATCYAFWRWTVRQTAGRLAVVGVAAGLALAAKHSTVLLAPMLVVLAVGIVVVRWRTNDAKLPGVGRLAAGLVGIVLIAVGVLWAFYGFRFGMRPGGVPMSPSLTEYVGPLAGVEARGILLAAKLRLLPESWLFGLADVRAMANGMPSYFFGRVYAHGVWFYFPVLFTIKSTLGMLGLLVLTVVAMVRGWVKNGLALWFLIAPPAVYLVVAMDSHLNIGARHILPVWVFCCVLAGGGSAALARRGRAGAWVVGVLLFLHAASTVHAAPNYISYANEGWGGPTHTYRYLTDSNTDWAQQLVATSEYLRQHGVTHCNMAYFAAPLILPSDYGVPCKQMPTYDSLSNPSVAAAVEIPGVIDTAVDGPVLISAGDLNGFEFGTSVMNPYEGFRSVKPVAFIQDGIFVYEGRFAVPLASALAHAQRSMVMMEAKDPAGALKEAQTAERTAPGAVQVEMQLGDVEAAAGDKAAARDAYGRMSGQIETMEPDAREQWRTTVKDKMAKL
ncbi:ArnT family glycosyltransferase [Granulicella tundricola]|uniref:TPR repeat-containing protein n=1 Tax=Granulicella tundricola (strain ATCC BAA-1859 / DSM 23138 / MP5ACTX9) TaxID=1198114 RepID=E8X2U7_GRATM|nr:glycosyltransferase family 39 protein [Granulicella tundricola]ADW70394.1 TPR repeat-containing protein [Granulicella tundricola MP5ACTX9]